MEDGKVFYDCFLCDRPFQFGPSVYAGRHIPIWGVSLCDRCLRTNGDGVVIEGHPKLAQHLKDKRIPIVRNAKGWVDIPGYSSN